MKAYIYEHDGNSDIVWADTVGKAKYLISLESGEDFTQIRITRAAWADQYLDMELIPDEVYLQNGFGVMCKNCGKIVYQDEAIIRNGYAYCVDCDKVSR